MSFPTLEELTRRLGQMALRREQFQQEITALLRAIDDLKQKESGAAKTAMPPKQNPETSEAETAGFGV